MRVNALAKLLMACSLLSMLGGCELMRWNSGREFVTTSAGYAGRFRIAYGHWPSTNELEEFMCMRGRADRFGLELRSCDEFVKPRYRAQLTPVASNLHMTFYDSTRQEMCRLTVLAPSPENENALSPAIVIKTTVLACPGDKTDPCVPHFKIAKKTP